MLSSLSLPISSNKVDLLNNYTLNVSIVNNIKKDLCVIIYDRPTR